MMRFVSILNSQKGVTLIELLVGLTLAIIISGLIYSVMITGYKTYEKIGIEGRMRDEADLAITQILETLYQFKVDNIEVSDPVNCPLGTCITLLNDKEIKIDNADGNFAVTQFDLISDKGTTEKRIIKIDGHQIKIYTQTGDSGPLNLVAETNSAYDFSKTKLYANCTKKNQFISSDGNQINSTCVSAAINVKLAIDNDPTNTKSANDLFYNELELESQFGF